MTRRTFRTASPSLGCVDAMDEDDASGRPDVPISAIEHFSYCPRQCALIHVEQTFDENLYTVRGRLLHEVVDAGVGESSDGARVLRALPLWSERYGLIGKADVVELRPAGPYPIEYKSGRTAGIHADLQLCAQGFCLEEMFGQPVPTGAIYQHAERRRREVKLDERLRTRTAEAIEGVRVLLQRQVVPPPIADRRRCRRCSLLEACLPGLIADRRRVAGLGGALFRPAEGDDDA